jgi:hypothetical protein
MSKVTTISGNYGTGISMPKGLRYLQICSDQGTGLY